MWPARKTDPDSRPPYLVPSPAEHESEIGDALREYAPRAPVAVEVTGLRLLGGDVAYTLRSPAVAAVRAEASRRDDRGRLALNETTAAEGAMGAARRAR